MSKVNKIRSFVLNYPLWSSCLINAVLLGICLLTLNLSYNTRDDIGMMLLSKGVAVSNEPTSLILFSSPILGNFINLGFEIFPTFNFYTAFYILVFYLVHVFLLMGLIKMNKSFTSVFVSYFIFYFLFSTYILVNLQFTIFSTLSSLCSVFFILVYLNKKSITSLIISVLFFVLAVIIRPEMAIISVFLSSPFLIFHAFKLKKIMMLTLVYLSFIFIYIIDYQYTAYNFKKVRYDYRDKQIFMATYFTDYKLYSKLNENRRCEIRNEYNISENDIELFEYFVYRNTEKNDFSKSSNVNVLNDYKLSLSSLKFKTCIFFIVHLFKFTTFKLILILFLIAIVVFRGKFWLELNFKAFLFNFLIIIGYYFLSHVFLKKSPERIVISLSLISAFQFLIIFSSKQIFSQFFKSPKILLFCIIFGLTFYQLFILLDRNEHIIKKRKEFYSSLKILNSNQNYVNFAAGLDFQHLEPWENLNNFKKYNIYFLGSGVDHPAVLRKFKEFKEIGYLALLKPNYTVVTDSQASAELFSQLISTYFKEKYNLQTVIKIKNFKSLSLVTYSSINLKNTR